MRASFSIVAISLFCIAFASTSVAYAQTSQKRELPTPPQGALDACASKTDNATCSFVGRNNETVSGVCEANPENKVVCKPDTPPSASVTPQQKTDTVTLKESKGFWRSLFDTLFGWWFKKDTSNSPSETSAAPQVSVRTWTIPDTNQTKCYGTDASIPCPSKKQSFYGQDGNYARNAMSYTDNGDGTVTDNVTGLMWIKDAGDKVSYYTGVDNAKGFTYAGYSDWRVPTIKELYSLIDFSGEDINPLASSAAAPFINDDSFVFKYGDTSAHERIIDSQWITSNIYVAKVMDDQECFFGVNFADGRIKCYPTASSERSSGFYLRLVRGETGYGVNNFVDNKNETITDTSSGLTWQKGDNGKGVDWETALAYCENLSLGGSSDWRLPDAHELQYIVDYTRSPDTTSSPAIDPIFTTSSIANELGQKDWPFFWTSTTHASTRGGAEAAYISFGRAMGKMDNIVKEVHGAGAQRSDPKTGNANDYPQYFGPQGDAIRVFNYARCVRG